jgi:hypothetical protein
MLTGQHPFGRETALQTLSAIMETDPAPMGRLNPRVPAPLRWSVERCLNKTPGARYASTRDLAGELRTLQTHLPELISGTAPSPRLSLKSRYLRATLITIGALLVLCPSIYLLLFSGSRMNRSGDGTRPAQKEPEEQAVFQLGLFSKKILLDREKYKGFPISLDIQNAALRDVMNFFSEVSGRSIILDPQTGWEQYRLSTKLTEVPWDQALDLTCRMNGLGYVIEGKVIRVAPASNLERELEKLQRVIEQQRPPSQTTQ